MFNSNCKLFNGRAMHPIAAGVMAMSLASCGGSAVAATPFVLAYTDGQDPQSYTNLQNFHTDISAVALGSTYGLLSNGTVDTSGLTSTTSSIISYAKTNKIPVYGSVSDFNNSTGTFDPSIMQTIDASSTSRANAVTNLVNLAVSNGFAGINLDVEAVGQESGGPTASDTTNFTSFVTALATALHGKGLKLIQSVPPTNGTSNFSYVGAYNYAQLGAQVDYLQVMTYDEVGPGWSSSSTGTWPGPCSGLDWMNNIITYAVSQVSPAKILLGLPTYGYEFSGGTQQTWAADANYGTLGFAGFIASKKATTATDATSSTPYANWGTVKQQSGDFSSSTAQPTIWYDNATSITAKAALVPKYGLGGTGVWAMGYEDGTFWSAHNAGIGSSSGGGGGSSSGNIAPSGTGYVWSGMSSATANTGKVANSAVNNGNTTTAVTLNATGEGGAVKYEAAGVTFSSTHSVTSVTYTNGPVDANGNGFFQSGFAMEYTTNGTTWVQSGWTASPAYPNSSAAANQVYTFSGTALSGVTGIRVVGATGSTSWSGSVTEVTVVGK